MNKLTPEEIFVIKSFANLCVPQIKEMILKDLEILTIKESAPDRAFIIFDLPGYNRPVCKGQRTYGMDGKLLDKDGAEVLVLLYADENNRMLELEFVRWDSKKIISLQWETLRIYG